MGRKLCLFLRSKDPGQSVQSLSQAYDGKAPEIEILGIDKESRDSAWTIKINYEGDGTFTVRSKKGSRIAIRGSQPHDIFAFEEAETSLD